MFITNDVALVIFVPITLKLGKMAGINLTELIIIQTISANLGSAITPFGNPQNLFLYTYYQMSQFDFFITMMPFALMSIIFLLILLVIVKQPVRLNLNVGIHITEPEKIVLLFLLLLVNLTAVFNIIDYSISLLITIIGIFLVDKRLFFKVDYSLLFTFAVFFIFTGNLSGMVTFSSFVKSRLDSPLSVQFYSILFSQFISNVPCSILLSGFTSDYKDLLIGVNIGGLGTLIASMSSLISYKIYVKEYPENRQGFLRIFHLYNICGLIFLGVVLLIIY